MKNPSKTRNTHVETLNANTLRIIAAGGRGCVYASVYYSDGSIIEQDDGEDHQCVNGNWRQI